MTDAERAALELKISEMREPIPKCSTPEPDRINEWLSDGGSWLYRPWTSFHKMMFAPRPWTRDENANAVLLEEMPEPMLSMEFTRPNVLWACDPNQGNDPDLVKFDADRKVAVALAWIAMKEMSELKPPPGWLKRVLEMTEKDTSKWPRQMQVNAGIAHLKTEWHEKTVETLQQRIAELEREVAYAKDSNLAMLEVHRQELTIRDKSRENAWRYNASLTAALKTAREALKQIVDRDAWGVPRWNAHVIAQDAIQAIDKAGE